MSGWLAKVESVLEQVDNAAGAGANPRNSPSGAQRRLAVSAPPQKPAAETLPPPPSSPPQQQRQQQQQKQQDAEVTETLRKRVRSLELENEAQGEVVETLGRRLDEAVRARDAAVAAQRAAAATRADETAALEARVAALEGEVQAYAAALGTANAQVHELQAREGAAQTAAAAQAEALAARTAEVARLQQALAQQAECAEDKDEEKEEQEQEQESHKETSRDEKGDNDEDDDDTALGTAARQLADATRTDADAASLMERLRAVVHAAATVLGEERVSAALGEHRVREEKNHDHDNGAEARVAETAAAEVAVKREREAAAVREEALRREAARLRTDVLAAQEQQRTSEARAERLQRQLAAKAVLGAANVQLEARVRALTEAVAALQRENHRLAVAHGVTPAPVADPLARDTGVDCGEPDAASPLEPREPGPWAVLDDSVLAPLAPLLCRTRRARIASFLYAVAVHALLVLFFLVIITR